jgi:uncharacterized membrane protein (DUF4010 family)
MALRILILVVVANDALLGHVLVPVGALALGTFVAGAILHFRNRSEQARSDSVVEITNPFELTSAIKFGALFALVLVASKVATEYFGDAGTYAAGAIAGSTDADAISLSVARLAREGLSPAVAATTIFIAVGSNTLVKAGIAIVVGGWRFGRIVLASFGIALTCGAIALIIG